MSYVIKYRDRKGNVTTLADRFDCPKKANDRIWHIIEAQLRVGARRTYHRVANSLAMFTSWDDDYVEAWRESE